MDEIAELLRELITEVQGLRADVADIRGPAAYDLGDIHAQLVELGTSIGGPAGYILQDVVNRLGSPSVFGLDDIHSELADLNMSVRREKLASGGPPARSTRFLILLRSTHPRLRRNAFRQTSPTFQCLRLAGRLDAHESYPCVQADALNDSLESRLRKNSDDTIFDEMICPSSGVLGPLCAKHYRVDGCAGSEIANYFCRDAFYTVSARDGLTEERQRLDRGALSAV